VQPPAALEGVTVLDFSTVGPASRCTRILADYGARVVKIGAPASQRARVRDGAPGTRARSEPQASGGHRFGGVQIEPAWWAYGAARGWLRARIDLKAPEGRAALLRLATRADVVVESFRPGVADRLGIGYRAVAEANPRVVYCSTSGYGQTGPRAAWAGHDIDYLAVSGYLDCSGRRSDGGPALPGATLADSAGGGMHAAIAILAALLRRERTGHGERLDVAVADGVLSLMSLFVDEHLATGVEPGPGSDLLTGRYSCYDVYRCRDGRWLALGAIEPHFFANLCKALGLERWIPHQLDDARQPELRADLAAAFLRRDRDEWVAELAPADTCVAPVLSVAELARDPDWVAREAFGEATHGAHGHVRQVGAVLAGQLRPRDPVRAHDPAETDTDALLRDAGLEPSEIATLRRDGVIG
jgi:alpha-methylacyl-CoA racemase